MIVFVAGPPDFIGPGAAAHEHVGGQIKIGFDALCVVLGVGGLVGLDMKTLSVPPPTWDEVSMTMLNQLVGSPRQETVSLTLPLPTAYALQNAKEAAAPTWLFQTREGAMGVLQITGFTDNPRGVKIRYKLVQNPSLNL